MPEICASHLLLAVLTSLIVVSCVHDSFIRMAAGAAKDLIEGVATSWIDRSHLVAGP